jgi:hypothetical protein
MPDGPSNPQFESLEIYILPAQCQQLANAKASCRIKQNKGSFEAGKEAIATQRVRGHPQAEGLVATGSTLNCSPGMIVAYPQVTWFLGHLPSCRFERSRWRGGWRVVVRRACKCD